MAAITDPTLIFTVMIATTLVVPLFAEKLRIPDLVLLLLAGALLGPHGLGLLERNSAIMLFSSVGLLYIMFLAGLEIDLPKFLQSYDRSIVFGLLTFAIPQGVGTLLGRYVLSMDWPQAILMASMFASHTLLAYPVASRIGIVRTEPVAVTIGATIITDILALMVLAVIADSAKGVDLNLIFWVKILSSLAILIMVGWWGIPWLSRWFFRNNSENGIAQFLFVLGVVCAFAYASHYARMEPIIGAFLAGIAFNQMIPRQSTLMNRVEFMGHAIFIPFFLISVGMLVNLGEVTRDSQSWLVAGTMVCGVILTKYAAAQSARLFFGYTRQEGQVMFGLSVVQAAATLAAALVGYELGIFGESVLNGAIAMILVTCPLGSWAVDRYGRQMVVRATPDATRRRSEQRMLIPVVNPSIATHLLDLAFVLRDASQQNILHPLTIIPDEGDTATALDEGEKLMAHCLTHAASAEVSITPGVRIGLNPSDGIIRAAKEMRADVVVLGWGAQRTVATRIFGSIRKRLLQECPSRLLFCRLVMPLNTTRRLLLPLPPQSEHRSDIYELVGESKRLARELGASLHVYLCEPESAESLRDLIEKMQPEMPVAVVEHTDWVSAREQLFEDVTANDMAVLPVERRLGAFWTPSLDRLPDVMAARFMDMNLISAYPALFDVYEGEGYEVKESPGLSKIIPISLHGTSTLEDALKALSSGSGAWNLSEQQHVHELLSTAAAAYPVEMIPGTALLHAHSNAVSTTTLLVGAGGAAWPLTGLDRPVRILLVLISPKNQSPETHLAALAQIARAFRDQRIVRQAEEMTSAEQIAGLLKDIVQQAAASEKSGS